MKYVEIKRVGNEVVRVTVELDFDNGYGDFYMKMEWFDRHVRRNETKIVYDKMNWYMSNGGFDVATIAEHFTHLVPFINISGKDLFGLPSYPIQNTLYYLNKGESFEYGCKYINVSLEVGAEIMKYSPYHFGEFLKKHVADVTKPLADKAIKLLEELTGSKLTSKENISGQLFNDLHYLLVTKEKGWNVYKDIEDKENLTYNAINSDVVK